jgi:myo-inositol-1(or 4)-monophosphatase
MSDSHELLELAAEAARTGGELLLARTRAGAEREIDSKSTPTDLVSEADLASEHAIRELLARRRPADGFLGEEGGGARDEQLGGERAASGLTWVVDPLDGTVNFVFGIPQWCVSVAVRDGAGTIAGAVFDPNRNELFTATRDGPASLHGRDGTRPLQLAAHADRPSRGPTASDGDALAGALVATGLAYDARVRAAQGRVLERLVSRVRDVRRFGSAALDLVWTAAGRYDAYFERSVKEWDIAAGVLICERAGLTTLELPVHPDLPWGVLVAPQAIAAPLLELVGGP